MKWLINLCRILVAGLFIFSGIVKINDPTGTAIKLDEYLEVFANDVAASQDSIVIEVTEANKSLLKGARVLYRGDESIGIEVASENTANKDTNDKVINYTTRLTLFVAGTEVAATDFTFADSIIARMLVVKAYSKNPLYSNNFLLSAGKITKIQHNVNVADLIKKESILFDFFLGCKKYTLYISLIVCALEIILGFALLIGWRINFVIWLLILLIAFFTFLTGYSFLSAYCPSTLFWVLSVVGFVLLLVVFSTQNIKWRKYLAVLLLILAGTMVALVLFTKLCFACSFTESQMKVTDCGCFGDFIKLKPWQTFIKDLILMLSVLFIFAGKIHIKPLFSAKFGWTLMVVFSLLAVGFGIFCYRYLPVWDFLPFKQGNNILQQMKYDPKSGLPEKDSVLIEYHQSNGRDSVVTKTYQEYEKYYEKGYTKEWQKRTLIYKGYVPAIRDFDILNPVTGKTLTDSILGYTGYQLVWICPLLEKSFTKSHKKLEEIAQWCIANKVKLIGLTATGLEATQAYSKQFKLKFPVYNADLKVLKTMARYPTVLYLMKGATIIDKWSARWLPSINQLEKRTGKK